MFPLNMQQMMCEIEAYWNNRMCELVSQDRLEDSDALYLAFVVDGEEPEGYMFMQYLNGVC